MQRAMSSGSRPRIVIIGAGFAGLSAAKALRKAPVDLIVIDRHNYHLFQPLLYQVATAGLSPADIAAPIRQILGRQANATVILADVSGVDVRRKEVIADGRRVRFDKLVIATGAQHAYFGHEEWGKYAPGLKRIDDATYVRRQILLAFERAETETDEEERRRLLNFIVVGAGPTGVEMAGAIAELAKKALARDFRTIDPAKARIILIEAGPRVLPSFDPSLATTARRGLEKLGVEVRLGGAVTACDKLGVALGGERIEARTIIWAARVMASPAGKWLNVETDRSGRVVVSPDLAVPSHRDIFVLGDTACVTGPDGKPLPGIAPVAKAQGAYIAARIVAELGSKESPPFRYRDLGSLATIGRKSAVVQMGRLRLTGFIAWLIWSVAHIYFLIGFRSRLSVVLNWAWNYLTFQRGTRLITGLTGSRVEDLAEPPAPAAVHLAANERIRGAA
jgi:NADH:ubiquinone reductase (H+-translocating)